MKPWYEIKGDDEHFETAVNRLIQYLENNKNNPNIRISYENSYDIGFDDENFVVKYSEKEITIVETKENKLYQLN